MIAAMEEARSLERDMVADRRWLHGHPEIGFDLPETTAYVARRLREIGLEPEEIVKGGLVALVGDPKAKHCFMLRADMDALPMEELTDLSFASTNGFMHACCHDGHTAMLLAAARILKEHEDDLKGCVKIMFQPDEEGAGPEEVCGNEAMIDAGVLENPRVHAAAAIHLIPSEHESGKVVTRKGTAFSSVDDIDITVHGRGGHGSKPHQAIDPFTIACHTYLAAQNAIARELDPSDQAVITFGMISGGEAANVIPDTVRMVGTLRTVSEETRARLKERLDSAAQGIAQAFGGSVEVKFLRGVPCVHNDPKLTDELVGYIEEMTGRDVVMMDEPISGSDDMSVISQVVPTSYFVLGAGSASQGFAHPVHNPHMLFDEGVMPQGAAMLAEMAAKWLEARAIEHEEENEDA